MKLSTKDQKLFVKRLSMLLGAGMPLLKALTMLEQQSVGKIRIVVTHLRETVIGGRALSEGLGNYQNIFGRQAISLVAVGEMSGTLSEHLVFWGEQLGKEEKLKK